MFFLTFTSYRYRGEGSRRGQLVSLFPYHLSAVISSILFVRHPWWNILARLVLSAYAVVLFALLAPFAFCIQKFLAVHLKVIVCLYILLAIPSGCPGVIQPDATFAPVPPLSIFCSYTLSHPCWYF